MIYFLLSKPHFFGLNRTFFCRMLMVRLDLSLFTLFQGIFPFYYAFSANTAPIRAIQHPLQPILFLENLKNYPPTIPPDGLNTHS